MREVAVTGLGLISPLGLSVDEAFRNALKGANGISRCDERLTRYGAAIRCRVAGLVKGFEPTKYFEKKFAERYDPMITFATAAADEAIRDASLDEAGDRERYGCVIGVAAPGGDTYQKLLPIAFVDGAGERIPSHAAIAISGNMPAGVVALRHKLRGPNTGVVNACASGANAIAIAADQIRLGRADVMVAGGSEATIGMLIFASFVNAGGMNPTDDPVRASAPFSLDRSGFVNAEGAGILVLEEVGHARARGARVYAILRGYASTNDAHHIISPEKDGGMWHRTMSLALADAGLGAADVGVVSAHAASTKAGDLAESRALRKLLGGNAGRVPISATKSMHGHAFGAAAAIETVLALAAMQKGKVLPTTNWISDPECDLDYVPNEARPLARGVLLKNSFGFGGTNMSLVFESP